MSVFCQECGSAATLTTGRTVYPSRPGLWSKPIWRCDSCNAYVGCHPGTLGPLGTPAGPELRLARRRLHVEMIDPLWIRAERHYDKPPKNKKDRAMMRRIARVRVYAFLAMRLELPIEETHLGMFDIEKCRAAWRAMRGATYPQIREWAKRAGIKVQG